MIAVMFRLLSNYYEKHKYILDAIYQNISLPETRKSLYQCLQIQEEKPFYPFDTLRHLQCAEDEKVSRKLQVVCLNYCPFRVANYRSTYLMYNSWKYNMYLAWEHLNPRRVDQSGWIYFHKLLSWLRNWIWREEKKSLILASSNSPPPPFDIIYFDLIRRLT